MTAEPHLASRYGRLVLALAATTGRANRSAGLTRGSGAQAPRKQGKIGGQQRQPPNRQAGHSPAISGPPAISSPSPPAAYTCTSRSLLSTTHNTTTEHFNVLCPPVTAPATAPSIHRNPLAIFPRSHGASAPRRPHSIPRLGKNITIRPSMHAAAMTDGLSQADSLTEEQVSEFKEAFSLFVSLCAATLHDCRTNSTIGQGR
jgi:hypothetical protein